MKKFALLLAVLAFFAGMNVGGYFYQMPYLPDLVGSQYEAPSVEGFAIVEPRLNATTVYLISGCSVVSFDVTVDQAYSIAKGLEKSMGARPLTHDILKDVLDVFGIDIVQVRIDRYEDGIYYATIFLRSGDRILELDARPSDSIALALRSNKPIYFRQPVLEANGRNIC